MKLNGLRIKHIRTELGMNQKEFADAVGYNFQTIASWERDSDVIRAGALANMHEAGINADYILGLSNEMFILSKEIVKLNLEHTAIKLRKSNYTDL